MGLFCSGGVCGEDSEGGSSGELGRSGAEVVRLSVTGGGSEDFVDETWSLVAE